MIMQSTPNRMVAQLAIWQMVVTGNDEDPKYFLTKTGQVRQQHLARSNLWIKVDILTTSNLLT